MPRPARRHTCCQPFFRQCLQGSFGRRCPANSQHLHQTTRKSGRDRAGYALAGHGAGFFGAPPAAGEDRPHQITAGRRPCTAVGLYRRLQRPLEAPRTRSGLDNDYTIQPSASDWKLIQFLGQVRHSLCPIVAILRSERHAGINPRKHAIAVEFISKCPSSGGGWTFRLTSCGAIRSGMPLPLLLEGIARAR